MDQLAYHRQQRDFPHDGFPPWAGKANVQLTIVIADRDLARVIAKIAQPVEVILAKKGKGGQPAIFIIPQPQVAHGLHLLADRVGIDAEQVVSAAAKLRRHIHIAVAVEDSLLHVQLIGIRIKQRVQYRRSELCHGAQ